MYTVNERKCWGQNDSLYSNEDRLSQCEEESGRRCQMICSIPFTRLKIWPTITSVFRYYVYLNSPLLNCTVQQLDPMFMLPV
jgi:hypothetical protein